MSGIRNATPRRPFYARRSRALFAVVTTLAGLLAGLLLAPSAQAAPPTPPSASTAISMLNSLTVKSEGTLDGYSRDLFPHWITQYGTCNTREVVLKRDGSNVVQDSACAAVSGSWYSQYDGVTKYSSSEIDIDHVVPLAEAWRSGANTWTTSKRQAFANDLNISQLIAVSASSNRSKGDQDPSTWWPTRTTYQCMYARMWVNVKYNYGLSLQSSEKSALLNKLYSC